MISLENVGGGGAGGRRRGGGDNTSFIFIFRFRFRFIFRDYVVGFVIRVIVDTLSIVIILVRGRHLRLGVDVE